MHMSELLPLAARLCRPSWPRVLRINTLLLMRSLNDLNEQAHASQVVSQGDPSVSYRGKPLISEREAHGERLVRRVSMASAWALLGHVAANS